MPITLTAVVTLTLLAVLCEAVTEAVKDLLPAEPKQQAKRAISLVVGVALAAVLQISLFAGATDALYVAGVVLAGLLCSRGSNYIHDLFGMFSKIGDSVGQNPGM